MITRMVVQTAIWLAAMATILFLAAGDWGWPQGWVFLGEVAVSTFAVNLWLRDTIRRFLRHASPRRCGVINGPGTAPSCSWACSSSSVGWCCAPWTLVASGGRAFHFGHKQSGLS
jgi:hypothetical protein